MVRKAGDMVAAMIAQTPAFKEQNQRLNTMFAKLRKQNQRHRQALGKDCSAILTPKDDRKCGDAPRYQAGPALPDLRGSKTGYRQGPKVRARNAVVVDLRAVLTAARKTGRIGLWFLHLRDMKDHP